MSLFNFDFDIAAIIIYVVVLLAYLPRKHLDKRQHIIFIHLYLCALFTALLDILSSVLINYKISAYPVHIATMFYYLCKVGMMYFFILYVLSLREEDDTSSRRCVLMVLPLALVALVVFTNPFTGWLYTYRLVDDVYEYHSGKFRIVSYIVIMFYYFLTVFYVERYNHEYNSNARKLIVGICLLNVMISVSQLLHSSLLLYNIAFAISMLILIIYIDNYASVVDSVTGLARRDYFDKTCEKNFKNHKKFDTTFILFSKYDDMVQNYGIPNIEQLTIEVGRSVHAIAANKGSVSKISNNCLALVTDYSEEKNFLQQKINQQVNRNWIVAGVEIPLEAMITTVSSPDNVTDMDSMIAYAQAIRAIQDKTGIVTAEDIHLEDAFRVKQVTNALTNAIKENRFEMYYQPICTAKEQKFVTAEALIRLNDPELGWISPEEFIPIAEKSDLILKIGRFVLDEVCSFIEKHDLKKLGLNYIELNLSTIQCMQASFIDTILSITKKHKIKPENLCFEITETGTTSAPIVMKRNLEYLTDQGYMLALDDFGTGYSSIQRMVSSDYEVIKFDKQLTQQFSSDEELKKVYTKLQSVFKTMGSKVVSEGVETKEQYEFVRDAGCGYIQGFYFSKPLPAEEFCSFIEAHKQNDA